jgi:glutathione S-transferase
MNDKTTLYGFDGSTYVRTVKMVMMDKDIGFDQVMVNVLEGEPRQPAHLARHPFGKVPVLDIDGIRIRETDAICRYLDATRPTPSLVPSAPKECAKMAEAINLVSNYGYGAMLGSAGFHLFPDFIGVTTDAAHDAQIVQAKTFLTLLMDNKGEADWLAGDAPSLADYFLAPLAFYVSITPDAEALLTEERVQGWWDRMKELKVFKATAPDLG